MGSICDACMSYGKKLIVVSSNDDPDTEMDLVQELLDQQVEGLIVASGYNTEYYEQLDKTELPVILVDRVPPQPSIDSVSINHKDSTGNVIDNLIDKGYEKIYIITRKHNNPNSTIYIRIQAALSTCEKRFGDQEHSKVIFLQGKDGQHNILTDDIYSDDEIKSYIQATYAESAKYPVALFIADTYIFGRFICACYMLGITFSEHFTLAGYDSWNYKNFVKQSICTIEQPLIKLGDVAIKQLIKRINDNSEDQDDQVLIQLINNKVHC
jgi:DNA-binding LacI/PurR family transcriptional regulator